MCSEISYPLWICHGANKKKKRKENNQNYFPSIQLRHRGKSFSFRLLTYLLLKQIRIIDRFIPVEISSFAFLWKEKEAKGETKVRCDTATVFFQVLFLHYPRGSLLAKPSPFGLTQGISRSDSHTFHVLLDAILHHFLGLLWHCQPTKSMAVLSTESSSLLMMCPYHLSSCFLQFCYHWHGSHLMSDVVVHDVVKLH